MPSTLKLWLHALHDYCSAKILHRQRQKAYLTLATPSHVGQRKFGLQRKVKLVAEIRKRSL